MGTSRSGLYLNTHGSSRKVSDYALVHSDEGTFMNINSKSPFRMKNGGHGEANIKLLNKYGIGYKIVKIYPNGVRVGSVSGHKDKRKKLLNQQTWFPTNWSRKDILRAGEHVASLKANKHVKDGMNMYGIWKGVRVVVKKTNGIISTIFPDINQNIKKKGKK